MTGDRTRQQSRTTRLSRRSTFILLVVALLALMVTASAPSPIYPVYRERWDFSLPVLTVVFAVYVVGLLGALLTVGSLSDHLGRRPVLVAASLIAAVSTLLFSTADGVSALLVARLVQGVATGTATGALAAALVEFEPESRPGLGATLTATMTGLGMALGSAVAGGLVALTDQPDRVAFPALTVAFVAISGSLLRMPDRGPRRPRALRSLRPDVRVPAEVRRTFARTVPTTVAGWASTGLFLAIVPSLLTAELDVRFAAAGGLSIAVLFVAVSIGGLWAVRRHPADAVRLGSALLATGAGGVALSIHGDSFAALGATAAVAGLGVGMTFNGNLRLLSAAVAADRRSQVLAAAYVVSYGALSVSSLVAGLAAPWLGLRTTGILYALGVATLALAGYLREHGRSR